MRKSITFAVSVPTRPLTGFLKPRRFFLARPTRRPTTRFSSPTKIPCPRFADSHAPDDTEELRAFVPLRESSIPPRRSSARGRISLYVGGGGQHEPHVGCYDEQPRSDIIRGVWICANICRAAIALALRLRDAHLRHELRHKRVYFAYRHQARRAERTHRLLAADSLHARANLELNAHLDRLAKSQRAPPKSVGEPERF